MTDQENERPIKPDERPDELAEHRARMRHDWSNLIEDLIEEGRQQGLFENLPGKGKPLKLDNSPFGQENALAHDLLRKNELKPAWIANRTELMDRIENLRHDIQRTWTRYEQEYRYVQAESLRSALRINWDDACRKWDAQIRDLNKLINNFNLKRPSNNLEIYKLDLERELARVDAPRWLK